MRKIVIILFVFIFSIIFSLISVNAQNQSEQSQTSTQTTTVGSINLPDFSEKQLGPFKEIDVFIRKHFTDSFNKQYFLLNPAKIASQQGVVESFDGNNLVVSSNGFKIT